MKIGGRHEVQQLRACGEGLRKLLGLVPYCDDCGEPMALSYKIQVDEIITSFAKKNGWQIAKDKKRADDLCPVCLAKQSKAMRIYP